MAHYDVRCEGCGHKTEVEKLMAADFPKCPKCEGKMRRLFTQTPPVHFAAAGFYTSDVARFEKQVGGESAARFLAKKDDAEKRAKAGRLTEYEKALEGI